MTAGIRRLLIASAVAAGAVGVLAILDMAIGFPFSRFSMMMDIMFLISSGMIMYMVWQCFKELR